MPGVSAPGTAPQFAKEGPGGLRYCKTQYTRSGWVKVIHGRMPHTTRVRVIDVEAGLSFCTRSQAWQLVHEQKAVWIWTDTIRILTEADELRGTPSWGATTMQLVPIRKRRSRG